MITDAFIWNIALAVLAVLSWIKISMAWNRISLGRFVSAKNEHNLLVTSLPIQKDILFVVNPVGGNGKGRKLFGTCLEALKATGRPVDVHITTGSEDVQTLAKRKDIRKYKSIVILSGDSTLYEFIQAIMAENKGTWPYCPILLLPGGSSNAIVGETFTASMPVTEIIQKGLSKIKKGPVLELSSSSVALTPPRYSIHTSFDGLQRHILESVDRRRHDLYTAFGLPALIGVFFFSFLTFPKAADPCELHFILSEIEGNGVNLGLGISRFDSSPQMIVTHRNCTWPGYRAMVKHMLGFLSGENGKLFQKGKIPFMQATREWTLEKKGHYFHIISDGTAELPFLAKDSLTARVIPNAIPYYVLDDDSLKED